MDEVVFAVFAKPGSYVTRPPLDSSDEMSTPCAPSVVGSTASSRSWSLGVRRTTGFGCAAVLSPIAAPPSTATPEPPAPSRRLLTHGRRAGPGPAAAEQRKPGTSATVTARGARPATAYPPRPGRTAAGRAS